MEIPAYIITVILFITAFAYVGNLYTNEQYFHKYSNPVEKVNSLVMHYQPRHIILYSFYPRFHFHFREMNVLRMINISVVDCVFERPEPKECSQKMNNSLIFFTFQPYCDHPVLQYEKRFCKAYYKNIKYFKQNYNGSRIIGHFNFFENGKMHNMTVIKT